MLNLTKRVDYGLIALTHLALHPGERLSVREVALSYHLSQPLLANVFKELARLGFVRSVRGTKGGYELALDPSSIAVGGLVEALEGPVRLAECIGANGVDSGQCGVAPACPVRRSVHKIHSRIREVLYGTTIRDLVSEGSAMTASLPGISGASLGSASVSETRASLAKPAVRFARDMGKPDSTRLPVLKDEKSCGDESGGCSSESGCHARPAVQDEPRKSGEEATR